MNKKAQEHAFGTFASIIIVVAVLILLAFGFLTLIKKGSEGPLKIFDEWLEKLGFGEKKELTTLNQKAQKNFDLLIQDMQDCLNKKDNDCKCNMLNSQGFKDFSDTHVLEVDEHNKLKLLIVKDKNKITKAISSISFPSCYAIQTGAEDLVPSIKIRFDEDEPYLRDDKGKKSEFAKGYASVLYRINNGRICWLTKNTPVKDFCMQ